MSNGELTENSPALDDEVFGGINTLTRSLRDLDDRGLVLSLAAFAEEALGELLKAFLISSDATLQLIEGFNAPLGTFSSRIKAAYATGLITKEQFLDLERLRKIRNEFAHTWKSVDISKQKIAALIDGMEYSRIDDRFPENLHEKIRSSMSCLLVEIRSSTHQIKENRVKIALVGRQLMRGFSGNFDNQILSAREELNGIIRNLLSGDKKKIEFYKKLLFRHKDRITVLAKPNGPEQKKELATLHEELNSALHRFST